MLTVISPFYNETQALPLFCAELRRVLDSLNLEYEVVLVDDGSKESFASFGEIRNWSQCRVLRLVGNVGHQNALDAGINDARGDWILTLDADLQHPPSTIPEMLRVAVSTHCDVVQCVRRDRQFDGLFKRLSATIFYSLIRRVTGVPVVANAADFRLMSRPVVDVLNAIPEPKVFRLLLPTLGFPTEYIFFQGAPRVAGESKYSLRKMTNLAVSSALQFSSRPLQGVILGGIAVALVALVWLVFIIISFLAGNTVEGWASLSAIVLLLGSSQLISMGLIGIYVGKLYDFSKQRPRYIISKDVTSPPC